MGSDHHDRHGSARDEDGEHGHGRSRGYGAGTHALPGGLAIAANGLRLAPSTPRLDPGASREWTYRIYDDAGAVVTEFEETHDRLAHLVLVRRDLTRFQHLHPEPDEEGTWSASVALPNPGAYRAFVDIRVDGRPTTLGVDLFASGPANYAGRPGETRDATAGDYEIAMIPDDVPVDEDAALTFAVRRGDEAVRLEPYLGALGHLVALRAGDLAYLHVHPEETDPDDGLVRFAARFPTPGRYRLFLQVEPEGELVTASFDVTVGGPSAEPASPGR